MKSSWFPSSDSHLAKILTFFHSILLDEQPTKQYLLYYNLIAKTRNTLNLLVKEHFPYHKILQGLQNTVEFTKKEVQFVAPIKLKNKIPGWNFEKLPKLTWLLSESKMTPFHEFFPHCDPVISTEKYVIDVCHFLLQGSTYLFVST